MHVHHPGLHQKSGSCVMQALRPPGFQASSCSGALAVLQGLMQAVQPGFASGVWFGDCVMQALRHPGVQASSCSEGTLAVLQGLMQAAILARTPAMAASLQCVLAGLHEQKTKDADVDALLTRLYSPILFRGLSAANACVRRNSLLLLLEAFPLQVRPAQNTILFAPA